MTTILEVIEKDDKVKNSDLGDIGINIDVMASWSYYSRKRTTRVHRPTSYYIRRSYRRTTSTRRSPRRGYYHQFRRLFSSSRRRIRSRSYYIRRRIRRHRTTSSAKRYLIRRHRTTSSVKRYLHRGLFTRSKSYYKKAIRHYVRYKYYSKKAKTHYVNAKKYLHRGLFSPASKEYRKAKKYYSSAKDEKRKAQTYFNKSVVTAVSSMLIGTKIANKNVKRGLKSGIYTPYGYFKSEEEYVTFLVKKFPEIYVPKIREMVSNWIRKGDPRLKDYWRNPEKWRAKWREEYAKDIEETIKKKVEETRRWKEQARRWILWYYALPKKEREKVSKAIDEKNKLLKELKKAEKAGNWAKVNAIKERIKQLDAIISGKGLSPNVPPPDVLNQMKIQVSNEKWEEFRQNPSEYFNLIARIKELMAQRVTDPSLRQQLLIEAQKYRTIAQKTTSPLPVIKPIAIPTPSLPSLPKLPSPTEIPRLISQKFGIPEKYVKYGAIALSGLILLLIVIKLLKREEEW